MSTQSLQGFEPENVVEFSTKVDEKNPVLEPLLTALNQSKMKCVKHYIDISEIYINISSKYRLCGELGRISDFTRSLSVVSNKPLNEQNIKVLIEWSKGTHKWVKEIKKSHEINLSDIARRAHEKERELLESRKNIREILLERQKIEFFWKKIFSTFSQQH